MQGTFYKCKEHSTNARNVPQMQGTFYKCKKHFKHARKYSTNATNVLQMQQMQETFHKCKKYSTDATNVLQIQQRSYKRKNHQDRNARSYIFAEQTNNTQRYQRLRRDYKYRITATAVAQQNRRRLMCIE